MYNSLTEADDQLVSLFSNIYTELLECFYRCIQEEDDDTVEKVLEMFSALTSKRNDLFDNNKLNKLIELFCTNEVR